MTPKLGTGVFTCISKDFLMFADTGDIHYLLVLLPIYIVHNVRKRTPKKYLYFSSLCPFQMSYPPPSLPPRKHSQNLREPNTQTILYKKKVVRISSVLAPANFSLVFAVRASPRGGKKKENRGRERNRWTTTQNSFSEVEVTAGGRKGGGVQV